MITAASQNSTGLGVIKLSLQQEAFTGSVGVLGVQHAAPLSTSVLMAVHLQ
jgi:hypothetical protein